jgi:Rrf2 family protein
LSYLINSNGSVSRAQSIASATEIPESFLAKILGQLCRSGLVRSHRGARGGFSLAVEPDTLNLLQVVEAMEGPLRLNLCDAPERCAYIDFCPIEKAWEQAEATLRQSLKEHRLADLARQASNVGLFAKKIA